MKLLATPTRSPAALARIARRRLLVRVRPLALAAAVALGATGPMAWAQTIITPLTGPGQTATVVTTQGNQSVVNTQSLRDGNAFSTYSAFQVGQGDVVKLAVPQGANWWVNIVRDAQVRVDGRLESRLSNGAIGGNILFVDSHGFAVGPSGQVDVGRLTFAAPSTTFVDGLLAGGGLLSGAAVNGLLGGQFDRSVTGVVDIAGRINAQDGVSLMAGAGQGALRAVSITGQVVVAGRAAGAAVNLGDLKSLTPLQDRDGVIDITTSGSIKLDGVLISDSALWRQAGAVRVLAAGDIELGANTRVSASAAAGSGQAGGQVTLFAQRDIANTPGALLRARGDGAGAGGAIEYSGLRQLRLSSMNFDAGSDTGQTGLVYLDPSDAVISGTNFSGGANLVYAGDNTLTVEAGAVINTRQVANGSDASNSSVRSTGNSGSITLRAPSITVGAGSLLDASVVNASGSTLYSAGDISLLAENTSSWVTLLGLANANASIDVAGTLKGRNVTLLASIESGANYDGASAVLTQKLLSLALEEIESPLALTLAYVEAKGDASVTVRPSAVISATKDISVTALADRSAGADLQVGGTAKANLSAGFARIVGSTKVEIESGAQLTAGEKIELIAASKTSIAMHSAAAGETNSETGAANVASVVFAGSMSDVNTSVTVGDYARLSSGTDTDIQAFHSGNYQTAAEVAVYGGGTAGVVGALSLQKSTTAVNMGGTINAAGNVRVMALNSSAQNVISATSVNAQEAPSESGLPTSLQLSNEEAKTSLAEGYVKMADQLGAMSEAASASGGSSGTTSAPALRLAGAITWSQSQHSNSAKVGAGAHITAGGDAVVDAQTLVGKLQSVGLSEATSKTKGKDATPVALSVAFNYATHSFSTRADVGANAVLGAGHVAVHAATDIPQFYTAGLPTQWDDFFSVYENLMGGYEPLFDGFNSRVGATSAGGNLALAGALNLFYTKNDTRAWVDTGAQISTRVADGASWNYAVKEVAFDSDLQSVFSGPSAYRLDKDLGVLGSFVSTTRAAPSGAPLDEINFSRSFSDAAVVQAETNVQTLHLAGGAGSTSGAAGSAVGGTLSLVDRDNTTIAGIADRAVIQTQSLAVDATTRDWLLTISPTAGSGAGMAANGMISSNHLKETTLASISREAFVTAPSVKVNAELALWALAVTGAVTQSDNSGVGIAVVLNQVVGDTRAYVGDNDADGGGANSAEGVVGAIATGRLQVLAKSSGMIAAVGVAGAAAGDGSKPPGEGLAKRAEDLKASVADASAAALGLTMNKGKEPEEPAEGPSQPPPFSVAGAGAVVSNFSDIDTAALLDSAVVTGISSGASRTNVQALSDLTQVSVAGGGALSMANNKSTTFSSAIAGAAAIQYSDDDTSARILNSNLRDLADEAGSLTVSALKSGERTAVATGISVNLSKGSSSDLSVVGSLSLTHLSDDTLASIENSTLLGRPLNPTAASASVVAYDRSRIGAGGGALSFSSGKGSSGIGATISVVDLRGSTAAFVSGGSLRQMHDLSVAALSSQKVVGVGVVAGVQTGADAKGQLMGAFVYNSVDNKVSAAINAGALVNLSGNVFLQAGGAPSNGALDSLIGTPRNSTLIDYEMSSTENNYTQELKAAASGESIIGVAGSMSVSLGKSATSVGLSFVQNNIQSSYSAELNGSVVAGGNVTVNALSRANIVGVAAGLGATKGKFSGMGSASVNLIGQRTQARLTGGSLTASSLTLDAGTRGDIFAFAGNVSFAVGGGEGNAAGGAVAYTQTGTFTYTAAPNSYVIDGQTYTDAGSSTSTRASGNEASISAATVNLGAGALRVQAHNVSDTQSVAASGAAADGKVAFAGTLTVNDIGDITDARISGSTLTAGTVLVQAGQSSGGTTAKISSLAGGVSASKGYSGALAFGYNTINSARSAQILASTVTASQSVAVLADAQASIKTLSVTIAGGKDYALAASVSTNLLNGSSLSQIDNSSIRGTATSLTLGAVQSGAIEALAGAVSGAGTGAIGGSLAVNLMGANVDDFKVTARLKDTLVVAPVAVSLNASLSGSIGAVAASGSGAGTAAVNGSITTNLLDANVLAEVVGGSQSTTGGAFSVHAENSAAIASLAGTISGAGTAAVGVAVSVNEIGGSVSARVQDFQMRANGAVAVDAASSGYIRSVAAGVAGGGTAGLAGSNSTNAITSTVLAQLNRVTQNVASASLWVQAQDSSRIESFAGSVTGGGTAAGGAAFALNFLGRTATDADSSKIVKAEVLASQLMSGGAVQVKALSSSSIKSIALAVSGSGNSAVTGSNTSNLLEDEITANWSGGSLSGSASSLTLQADDAATVQTFAGNVVGAGTAAAVGAAIAVNAIGSAVSANLSNMTLASASTLLVDANLRGQIKSVAASGAGASMAAVSGSFTTNALTASVKAQVSGLNQTANGGAFSVRAGNDADIFSLAGTISGSGAAAVGVAVSVNELGGDVTARLASSSLRATGAVTLQATTSGRLQSIAAGMTGGAGALTGSNTTNAITSTVQAQMDSVNMINSSSTLDVLATDSSSIESFAGAVAGGGQAAGGAALALNFLGRSAADQAAQKLVLAEVSNSALKVTGAVRLLASSSASIHSIGVAAGLGGSSAVTGSNSTNILQDTITANWSASSLLGSNSSGLKIQASDSADIESLAGNLAGGTGLAVGAAIAVNRVASNVNAKLSGSSTSAGAGTIATGDVEVRAVSDAVIDTIAIGMSASVGNGAQGSIAVTMIDSNTTALLDGSAKIQAWDSVAVSADSSDRIKALAGAVGLGASGVGAAGGLLVNTISSNTSAGIDGSNTWVSGLGLGDGVLVYTDSLNSAPDLVTISAVSDAALSAVQRTGVMQRGVSVHATSVEQIAALTSVVGGGAVGAGAAVNVDSIAGSTRAYVNSAKINTLAGGASDQAVRVLAVDHAFIASTVATLAGGEAVGVAGALATESVSRSSHADVLGGALIQALGDVTVKAISSAAVAQIAVGAGAGGIAGVAGSGSLVLLGSDTQARVDSSTLSANNVSVVADAANTSNLISGSVGGGGVAGVGLSYSVNVSGSDVRALVSNSLLQADGDVLINAHNQTTELAVAATVGGGGVAGVAIGAAVTVLEGNTQAGMSGSSTLERRTRATGTVASAGNAEVSLLLDSADGVITADEQGNTRFVLMRNLSSDELNLLAYELNLPVGSLTAEMRRTSTALGAGATVKVFDGTREVLATLNTDGSYSANIEALGDGQLTAVVYTLQSGVTLANSPSNRLLFSKAAGVKSLSVTALEAVDIKHNAGGIGGGGVTGVGSAVNVVVGRSTVAANVSANSVTVGADLLVEAKREAVVNMVTATAGGGGVVGVSGAVGVLLFGSAPNSNANSELNNGSGSSLRKISSGTESNKVQGSGSSLSSTEANALNSSSNYSTENAFVGASGQHSTSANLAATTVQAGSVSVNSLDFTSVKNNAGAVAGGSAAGVSAGVAITVLGGANSASISAGQLSSQGAISIASGTRTPSQGAPAVTSRAVAGAGGFVGVGAAVAVASNQTANSATLSGQVKAGGAVSVTALDQASMLSQAYGATAGVLSVGVVVATAEQRGSVLTQIGGTLSGAGVSINAAREGSVTALAVGGSAGVIAGSGAGATASDGGSVRISLASNTLLDAGQDALLLSARSNPYASADAVGVAAGGRAVGISIAQATLDAEVSVTSLGALTLKGDSVTIAAVLGSGDSAVLSHATAAAGGFLLGGTGASASSTNTALTQVQLAVGARITSSADAAITATDSMRIASSATGIGAGFVGLGLAFSSAVSNTTVAAKAAGLSGVVGGSLQVNASGNESIDSDAVAGSGGVVAGAGAQSSVNHDQIVAADLGVTLGSSLLVGGRTTLDASRLVRYNSHSTAINAAAVGASGAVTSANLDGSATARLLDGSTLKADSLRILATNDLARSSSGQSAEGGGGGVISGAGADVDTGLNGNASASIGNSNNLVLESLLELRAYNQITGSSLAQMDVGGAIPIALVNTKILSNANADAVIGQNSQINVYGESAINALSRLDIGANSVSKTYGLAAAAQGSAVATANVNNRVTIGSGSVLRSATDVSLLAGQDRDFNRNRNFVTARVDLFNHSAIPVSINPRADATLNLNNALLVNATAIRSGGSLQLGGVEGSYVVEGKGNVSDWTRDLGELVGVSSQYGTSRKNLSNSAVLYGAFEAGFGNKQRLVIGLNGQVLESTGDVRYTITNEDLSASASAYVDRLYDQLARYGDVPEVKAFVQAELSYYFAALLREGLAVEQTMDNGSKVIVATNGVAANFLNILNLRAGSGNIELFGNNVTGTASLTARADSEIYIENRSPLNLRVFDMVVDANGGFAKYNGTYLQSSADIAALNTNAKSTGLTVDSIDTRGGGAAQQLPTLTIKNTYTPLGVSNAEVRVTAADGTWADLREDQIRAPEMRVNGWLYNKLGTINLSNTAGSISVFAENPSYTPRLDGKEILVSAGKDFVLSSPSISQSVGGSPESLYAVYYNDDQKRILQNLGISACGSADPGTSSTSYNPNCLVNGAGGVYASGAISIGARYLNINGTVQSGQADYNLVLSTASVGAKITAWLSDWARNGGRYLSQGKSSLIQVSGALPTDSEAEINKQFANGTLTASQRSTKLAAMATRRLQPIVYFDAQTRRLKVAATNVQGGLVELVGYIINTGGGVVRALDGYAHINIDNQTGYGLDLLGLDTGGDAGLIRITDLGKPLRNADQSIRAYQVSTYQRDANGVFKATVTEGRGVGAAVISSTASSLLNPDGSVKARFSYSPAVNSTYSWSAGYEYTTEKHYYLKTSSYFGFIPGPSTNWNSVNTYVKTANAMVEDVYVGTTVPVGNSNFSIQTKTVTTDAEKQIYYRSWRKCGFMCIKKTYYVDRRTEVGKKDIFTQRVSADNPINIELIGYDTGVLNVKSLGDIRLGGNLTNNNGTVTLNSVNGAIRQLSSGAVVTGVDLNFSAKTGIGSEAAPINLVTAGSGAFTAVSNTGPVSFYGVSGALRINNVATAGDIWINADGNILGLNPAAVQVSGNRIALTSRRGGVGEFNTDGSVKSTINIQSANSTNGGLSANARNGIAIKQTNGNLWVNQVISGGDVYLEAGGSLIDNNRNDTRDERTEAQLLSLWDQAALQGSSAEASLQLTLSTTRAQYRRYWSLRDVRNVSTDTAGNVTNYSADAINPATYSFHFGTEERALYLLAGISESQILTIETERTQEVLALHQQFGGTVYQTNDARIISAVNSANLASGKAEVGALSQWTNAELFSPLPSSIFSKSTTATQTRIEEPNVVGNRVVLRSGGQVGRDDGQVVIYLKRADRIARNLAPDLTSDERLAIASAESDDMLLNRTNWTLTVVKKDTFNVLSNRLNVQSNGFIYLGADTTATYTNGGTANLEQITGTGEVRIKVTDSIFSMANAGVSVIQAQKAVLEAAQGAIGSAAKPIQMTLANNATGTLVARANDGIWIHQIGDMRAADIYTPGSATLSATGSIFDARAVINFPNQGDRAVRSIEANGLTLTAQSGSVGTAGNAMALKIGADGVNATSALGYSVYLQGAAGSALSLNNINSGLDFYAVSGGNLDNHGTVRTLGSINAQATGSMTGLLYTAGGAITLGAGGGISGGAVTATTGSASLTAGGDISLNNLTARLDSTATATGSLEIAAATAGRDLTLHATRGDAAGSAWRAVNNLNVYAGAAVTATIVSASNGSLTLASGGDMSLGYSSAQGDARLSAVTGAVMLTNLSSTTGQLAVTAGGTVSVLSASAREAVTLNAGTGVLAASLSSSNDAVTVRSNRGELSVQRASAAETITLNAVNGDLSAGALSALRGDVLLSSGGSMSVASASAPGQIVARAGGNADFSRLTSTAGQIDLASSTGALTAGAVVARTSFDAQALQGGMTLGSFNASTATLSAGSDLLIGSGTTAGAMRLSSAGDASLGTLTANAGTLQALVGGNLIANTVRATGLDLSANLGLSASALTSTSAAIDVASSAGSVTVNSATAKTGFNAQSQDSLTIRSFNAATATLSAGTDLLVSGGNTSGAMRLTSVGDSTLGGLSATAGNLTAQAAGVLVANTLRADSLDLSGNRGLSAGSLSSDSTAINLASSAGSLTIGSVSAKTAFNASSNQALTVRSFSAASTTLNAGTDLLISNGTSSGDMTLSSVGDTTLGTLTASAGNLQAQAAGNLLANTLRANALVLSGNTGLTASSLSSTSAGVDLSSQAGSVVLSNASVKTAFNASSRDGLIVRAFNAATATLDAGADLIISGGTSSGAIALTSAGNTTLGTLTATAGNINAVAAGRLLASSVRANALDLSGDAGLTAGTLSSTTGAVDLRSRDGSVIVSSSSAKTGFNATSYDALIVKSFNAATVTLASQGDLIVSGGTSSGAMTFSSAGNTTLGTLTATAGNINAVAAGRLLASSVRANALDLSGNAGLTAGTLSSSTAAVDLRSRDGSVIVSSSSAKTGFNATSYDALIVKSFNAATATLASQGDLIVSGGSSSGAMTFSSAGNTTLGTLTATAGNLSANAGGSLVASTLKANAIALSADAGLTAGSLTSTSSSIALESIAGSVTVNSATARTFFSARSGTSLAVRSFTVSAGSALLESGGSSSVSAGQATGNIEINSTGDVSLGSLTTSSTGQIIAQSLAGNVSFGTLSGGIGITLTANKAVSGSGLYVNRGRVDVRAKMGDISIGTLSVASPLGLSQISTEAGAIRVSKISGLTPSQLSVSANGGSKSLPSGY